MTATVAEHPSHARTRYPINELLGRRWSARTFAPTPVAPETLGSLFEAARWSPSAGNGQPWSFIVADKTRDPDGFARALATLAESNQAWVQGAPVLIFAITRRIRPDGKEHTRAQYDLGLATKGLVVEAIERGLNVRQMAGFDAEAVRDLYQVPAEHDPIVAIAVGYPAEPDPATPPTARERKPLEEFVFSGQFGRAYEGLTGE
jgi:nitroreductase